MPPRKSAASTISVGDANGDVSMISEATNGAADPAKSPTSNTHPKKARQSDGDKQGEGTSIDDLLLPRSLISRLTRGVLPANTSLQKDALLALTRSATVFVSYLSAHANEQSQLRHRKTLGVQDVYAALREIEFERVMELGVVGEDGRNGGRLEREVEVYEEGVRGKRKGYRDKVKARESGVSGVGGEDDGGEPSSKRARRQSEGGEEEERMLAQQLNGTGGADGHGGEAAATAADGIAVVVANGHTLPNGKERAIPATDGQLDDELEDPDLTEPDQDQPEEDEAEEDDAEDDDEEEEEGARNGDGMTDGEQIDHYMDSLSRQHSRARGLLPNGEVDVGSGDESD